MPGFIVRASDAKFWEYQYKGDLPHWMHSHEPSKLAERFVEEMNKAGFKDGDILEIGIGNGRDSIFFGKSGFKVVGIDITPRAVLEARKAYNKDAKGTHIVFTEMDAEDMSFDDSTFDGVYSLSVLHSTDIDLSFAEIYRVLRHGGLFMSFMYLETLTKGGVNLDRPLPLSKVVSTFERLRFKMLDLYVDIQKELDSDDTSVPHRHTALIMLLRKK